jgi:penicillin amidase
MITDGTSSTAATIVNNLIAEVDFNSLSKNEKEAYSVLKSWKATNDLKDVAPTIYNKWLYFYLKNTFKDELGDDNFKLFISTHIMKQVIASQIKNENSPWWDDIATKNRKETRKMIILKSFKESVSALEKQLGTAVNSWTWDKVHILEHQHPLGKVSALRSYFNVGPFKINGSNEVINNQMFIYSETGDYKVLAGPSTRRIIDFSDIENSWSILPTGQSGNPLSKHYSDQAEMYNTGKFRKMKMNKEEIIRTSSKLVFSPNKK